MLLHYWALLIKKKQLSNLMTNLFGKIPHVHTLGEEIPTAAPNYETKNTHQQGLLRLKVTHELAG